MFLFPLPSSLLTLPNDETLGQGKAVLRAFQDTDVKGVTLSLVRDDCQ